MKKLYEISIKCYEFEYFNIIYVHTIQIMASKILYL